MEATGRRRRQHSAAARAIRFQLLRHCCACPLPACTSPRVHGPHRPFWSAVKTLLLSTHPPQRKLCCPTNRSRVTASALEKILVECLVGAPHSVLIHCETNRRLSATVRNPHTPCASSLSLSLCLSLSLILSLSSHLLRGWPVFWKKLPPPPAPPYRYAGCFWRLDGG